jgi:dihydrofolate reductase
MRKLIVTEFVTLDGIMEAPEQWVFKFHPDETAKFKLDEMLHADALVLGKNTYSIFASSWPSMSGELADQMNGIRKHVISTTAGELAWHNSQAITGNPVAAVSALKNQHGTDILVAGSASVVRTLTQHRLVDEYRLLVCPLVLGSGQRLFTAASVPAHLTLAEIKTFDTGALLLRYEAAGRGAANTPTPTTEPGDRNDAARARSRVLLPLNREEVRPADQGMDRPHALLQIDQTQRTRRLAQKRVRHRPRTRHRTRRLHVGRAPHLAARRPRTVVMSRVSLATCKCQLKPLCRHHQAKQAPGGNLRQPEPGILIWTLPHGRSEYTEPYRYPA